MADDKLLVLVECGSNVAVYQHGRLVYYGDGLLNQKLLKSLGYDLFREQPVPAYNLPAEYDKDDREGWQPPELLEMLRVQHQQVNDAKRRRRIADLERELAELRAKEPKLVVQKAQLVNGDGSLGDTIFDRVDKPSPDGKMELLVGETVEQQQKTESEPCPK